MDTISGYNQIHVAKSSRGKLAFYVPNFTKYTYSVMKFGPKYGPIIFIVFIHDMESTQKGVAATRGIVVDAKTSMRLIVDEIYSWACSIEDFIDRQVCLH